MCLKRSSPKTIEYRSYKNYDKAKLTQDLRQVKWNIVENETGINSAVTLWNELFLDIANQHAPIKRLRVKGTRLPWMTS